MGDQDTGSAVYNIVAFCFDGQDTASQTLKDARSAGALEGYKTFANDQDKEKKPWGRRN